MGMRPTWTTDGGSPQAARGSALRATPGVVAATLERAVTHRRHLPVSAPALSASTPTLSAGHDIRCRLCRDVRSRLCRFFGHISRICTTPCPYSHGSFQAATDLLLDHRKLLRIKRGWTKPTCAVQARLPVTHLLFGPIAAGTPSPAMASPSTSSSREITTMSGHPSLHQTRGIPPDSFDHLELRQPRP